MHIIHVAAEVAPIAKIGGLADVVFGLSKMQKSLGHKIALFIPKYDIIDFDEINNLTCHISDLKITFNNKEQIVKIWQGTYDGLTIFFAEDLSPKKYFARGDIYGFEDDPERFLFFSKIFAEFLLHSKEKPDIVHIHDWQTAILAPLIKEQFENPPKVIMTIHNMEYQGRTEPKTFAKVGLKIEKYFKQNLLKDSIYPESVNLLKGGIIYSDFVTTVSPTYSEEVKTKEFGMGLDKLLIEHQEKFQGILNGIDYDYWNPANDKFLSSYNSIKGEKNISNLKNHFKRVLRDQLKLKKENVPLVGAICRLVPQKGVGLIKDAIEFTIENKGQFVFLGTSPIESIQEEFLQLQKKYSGGGQIEIILRHNEEFAHLIYAASDIFVIPSIFEPCGLTQMIALRYGAIPIVRSTGGLADTIFDVDTSIMSFEKTNGFTFKEPKTENLNKALSRAFKIWHTDSDKWQNLINNGLDCDFSWNNSAEKYLEIYENIKKESNFKS